MKKFLLIIALLISTSALFAYSFSAVCESGQTLFYTITGGGKVTIVREYNSDPYYNNYPTGNLIIPESVTYNGTTYSVSKIDNKAFSGCNGLTGSLNIPNSVTSIGENAFYGCCGLTTVIIPNSVTSIGESAFGDCSGIEEMTIPFVGGSASATGASSSTCFGYIFKQRDSDNGIPCGGSNLFYYAEQLYAPTQYSGGAISAYYGKTYRLPKSLKRITVTSGNIFYGAFMKCSNIETITLGSSVTNIAKSAFENCSGLKTLTIPNSLTDIDEKAFKSCTNLRVIYSNAENPPTIRTNTFESSILDIPVYVPCNSVDDYTSANYWSNFTNIQGGRAHMLHVTSANTQMGTAIITQTPDCTDATGVIAAAPNADYRFVSWSDGSTDNPHSVTVMSDTTFIASFASISVTNYTITAISANPSQGTVTGGGTYPEGTIISLTANANDGYQFASWSDNNTENPRQITVMSNEIYVASFVSTSGIDENITDGIAIYPNPVGDILNITSSETISEIEIVNVMGQVVKRMEINSDNAVCNLEDLTSGIYVVNIHSMSLSKRAIVVRQKFRKE